MITRHETIRFQRLASLTNYPGSLKMTFILFSSDGIRADIAFSYTFSEGHVFWKTTGFGRWQGDCPLFSAP